MRVILARHGDAANSSGKFHGLEDEPITSEGRKEAYRLAKELNQYHPSMIYYSPLSRTKDTARILASELHIPMKSAHQLHPLNLGNFVGKPVDKFLDSVKHYLKNPEEKIPGGQSVNEWAATYLPFFEKYFRNNNKDTIIFMTHGRNILLSKAYVASNKLAPEFDKNVLIDNNKTTMHGGHAIATPPNQFRIIDSQPVKAGQS